MGTRRAASVQGPKVPWQIVEMQIRILVANQSASFPSKSGERIFLVSMQGIFKPGMMDLPLSIRGSADGRDDDQFVAVGLLR